MNFKSIMIRIIICLFLGSYCFIPSHLYANQNGLRGLGGLFSGVQGKASASGDNCLNLFGNTNIPIPRFQVAIEKGVGIAKLVNPVNHLKNSWQNKDKRWFVFFEQPLIGLATSFFNAGIAFALNGIDIFVPGSRVILSREFIDSYFEIYIGYNGSNILRNGVNVNEKISNKTAVWLNWFYSTLIYTALTAGDKLALGVDATTKAHAYATVAYAGLWPIFSQWTSRVIWTPFLFSFFPKESMLDKIYDSEKTVDMLILEQVEALERDQALLEKTALEDRIKIAELNTNIKTVKANIFWIKFLRLGLSDGGDFSRYRKAGYWAIKTSAASVVSAVMITIYFTARWQIAGYDASDNGLIQLMFLHFLEQSETDVQVTSEFLEALPDMLRMNAEILDFQIDDMMI
ncbi:MAG: hypothetical protein ABIA04_14535 [Pseudomonadota bacterium]